MYNMATLTRYEFIELIKNGNDSHDNQIRVTTDGTIFISEIVGAKEILGLRFRTETYSAGNGYIGEKAASDKYYIDELYANIMKTWKTNRTGYIDYWI